VRDWRRLIHELSASFQRNEERLRILHQIDQQVLDINSSLEAILGMALENVLSFSRANRGCFYIHNQTEFLVLTSLPVIDNAIAVTDDDNLSHQLLQLSTILFEDLKRHQRNSFPVLNAHSETRVLIPVDYQGRLWGLVVLEADDPTGNKTLADPDIHEFLQIVRRQLEIAVRFRTQHRDLEQLSRIQNELFTRELDISESLDSLVRNILFALPSMGPLKIDPVPEIQILFYREKDEYLTIKATSGKESVNTRLFVSHSISGVLIERPEIPYYLCDPRDEPERYRSYLGRDEKGEKSKEIRTELVVRLQHDNKTIGVINLESELEGAFKIPHVQAMLFLAEKISPIVNALQKRMEKIRLQSRANVYAMKKFLDRFAGTYIHKMRSPIQSMNLKLAMLQEGLDKLQWDNEANRDSVKKKLQGCIDTVASIDRYHEEFSKSLSQYLTFGRYNINDLVTLAINDLDPKRLKEKERIEVVFKAQSDLEVFCSPFLREHIYNLLNNSVYAIRDRKKREAKHQGRITINTLLEVDEEAREINKRCRIRIHDNGIGLDAKRLAKIPEPFTTKHSGTGFGIPAAFQYLRGLGGGLTAESELGRFFEVNLYLDLYTEEIHGRVDPLLEQNNEVLI
jgi:signal transduction histidine kinase